MGVCETLPARPGPAQDGPDALLATAACEARAALSRLTLRLAGALGAEARMQLALQALASPDPDVRATGEGLAVDAAPEDLRERVTALLRGPEGRRWDARGLLRSPDPRLRELATEAFGRQGRRGSMLTTLEKLLFLREVPLLRTVPVEILRPLAESFTTEVFQPGERIFEGGSEGDSLYVVVSGTVAIERDDEGVRLAELGSRSSLGEMSLVSGEPRSASAVALEEATLLRLERRDFVRQTNREPEILRGVIRALSGRIRELDAERLRQGEDAP